MSAATAKKSSEIAVIQMQPETKTLRMYFIIVLLVNVVLLIKIPYSVRNFK